MGLVVKDLQGGTRIESVDRVNTVAWVQIGVGGHAAANIGDPGGSFQVVQVVENFKLVRM